MRGSVLIALALIAGACEPSSLTPCEGTTPRCYRVEASCCSTARPELASCDLVSGFFCPTGYSLGVDCGPIDPWCGSEGDAGSDVDAGPPSTPLPPVVVEGDQLASYSCRNTVTPMGFSTMFPAVVRRFRETTEPVGGVALLHFENDDPVLDTDCGGCTRLTLDADGRTTLSGITGARFAYVVPSAIMPSGDAIVTTVGQHMPVPDSDGTETELTAITTVELDFVANLVGRDPSAGFLFGSVLDCDNREVENAQIRLFGPTGEVVLQTRAPGPQDVYFSGVGVPERRSERRTAQNGLFGAAPLPADPDGTRYRVEIWGALTEGAGTELLACEAAVLGPDAATIVRMAPLSSFSPDECGGS